MRERIEVFFEGWGRLVWRWHWLVIVAMVGLAVGLGTRIPLVEVDTSTEGFLRDDDPVKVAYDELREQFGRDQLVILAIEPPEVFEPRFLRWLEALHRDLEASVPYLEDVTSLVNVRSTRGEGDVLVVEDLLEEMPGNREEAAALRELVMRTPLYLDGVVSADGSIANLFVETDAYTSIGFDEEEFGGFEEEGGAAGEPRPFITGPENDEIVFAVKEVVERHRNPEYPVRVAGSVLLSHELTLAMSREMPLFFGASLLVVGALLLALLRRVSPVLIALVVVVMAVVSTIGLAQLLGYGLTLAGQILPSFMLALGVGYSVHLLVIFVQELDAGGDRRAALLGALTHSGYPILLTGLTTGAGMLSFLAARVAPLNDFGVIATLGVATTLVYTLVLLPALLAALPLRPHPQRAGVAERNRLLAACGVMAARHPKSAALVTLGIALVSVGAATQVSFSSDPMAYLPPDHVYREAMDYIDARDGGTFSLDVVVDTQRENGLHDPDLLDRMEAMRGRVADYRAEGLIVRRTTSVLDVAKETHQALNENRPEFYAIPRDRQLLAQELLLFENSGSDDLEKLVDPQFQKARFTIRTLWADGYETIGLVDRATREFREIFGDSATLTVTGMSAVVTRSVRAVVESMARSYGLALLLITPLMALLIGSLRSGLVSMVPNLLPIVMTLALMSVTGIHIDMFTLMVGCVAIGLAVDDTIHLIAGFRRYLAQTGDPVRAVELALQTTGRALLFTSVVLTCGFLVLTLSSMANLRDFGLLTAFAISMAFILDVTATPALLVLVNRKRAPKEG
ncbi:MAG: efflux RND transporter permease subunit [Myxococcota bacterium]|nr:efflux RND transporter permease subunit [Myxococcota bacterium]